jgi:hypothetical protein
MGGDVEVESEVGKGTTFKVNMFSVCQVDGEEYEKVMQSYKESSSSK